MAWDIIILIITPRDYKHDTSLTIKEVKETTNCKYFYNKVYLEMKKKLPNENIDDWILYTSRERYIGHEKFEYRDPIFRTCYFMKKYSYFTCMYLISKKINYPAIEERIKNYYPPLDGE